MLLAGFVLKDFQAVPVVEKAVKDGLDFLPVLELPEDVEAFVEAPGKGLECRGKLTTKFFKFNA
jgi:hypothetical protein